MKQIILCMIEPELADKYNHKNLPQIEDFPKITFNKRYPIQIDLDVIAPIPCSGFGC